MKTVLLVVSILTGITAVFAAEIQPVHKLTVAERETRLQSDARATALYREGR